MGTVSEAARTSFVAALAATIEANGREDLRLQRMAEYEQKCFAAAAAKKTVIEQQAMVETLAGKGDGKGAAGRSYSARTTSIRQAPYEESPKENDSVRRICQAGIEAAKTQEF